MKIEFDPEKSARNARERGVPFELATEVDWNAAHIVEDVRRDYGEKRLHVVCFCIRGTAFRIISLRKANSREEKFYAEEKAATDR